MAAGLVHTTPGRDAVALWLPAGPGVPGPLAGYRQRLAEATAPWTGRFAVFDQALEAHHPAGVAHQHLAILAVRPGRQGQGIGTALLTRPPPRPRPRRRARLPGSLQPPRPRPILASRLHPAARRPVPAPRGPAFWPMWREPRARIVSREDRREGGRL